MDTHKSDKIDQGANFMSNGRHEGNGDVIPGFTRHVLDDGKLFWAGQLPQSLMLDSIGLTKLWDMHPEDYHIIVMHGRRIPTPRWQQAYGRDYAYTGRVNEALRTPPILSPYLTWAREQIDDRLNGLLLNWYDGKLQHYIGKHRDSVQNMIKGAPIITISLGETRMFRLRPWKEKGFSDFVAESGTVFLTPYDTNLAWTHEITKSTKNTGRRISITLRAFK